MSKEADFSEFKKFLSDFETISDDFQTFLKNFLLEMAYRVIARAKPRTPVDTGFLREAYYVGNEAKAIRQGSDGQFTSDYKSAFTSKATVESVEFVGNTLQVVIGNIAEYASFVELRTRLSKW